MSTLLICTLLFTQAKPSVLKNPKFEEGLAGWKVVGPAKVVDNALSIGPGNGVASQRYDVPGLRILYFGVTLKASAPDVKGRIRLQCFDSKNHLLTDNEAGFDPTGYPAIYLKTQAFTHHIVVSVEKTAGKGDLIADDVLLQDDDRDRVEHEPEVDLDAAMTPIWTGKRVFEESVLLLERSVGGASGKLMFRPTRLLSVRDTTLKKAFVEGKDFILEDRALRAIPGSAISTMKQSDFKTGEYPWTELQGRHVYVSYEHEDLWKGHVPNYQGDHLTQTVQKLESKKPLTVVAYGDSITLGINVSGFRNVPPYLPPWPSLAVRQLSKVYGSSKIKLYNAALGGMNSQWARDNAKEIVASLKPDLVLIAFGMNDFWSLTPELFRKNIEATLDAIRADRPNCEFILIAPIKFDPIYTADKTYVGNLAGYASELSKLVGRGVGFLDMTSVSDELYKLKSAPDLMTDPMHPDDFLARWYAQGVVALLEKP